MPAVRPCGEPAGEGREARTQTGCGPGQPASIQPQRVASWSPGHLRPSRVLPTWPVSPCSHGPGGVSVHTSKAGDTQTSHHVTVRPQRRPGHSWGPPETLHGGHAGTGVALYKGDMPSPQGCMGGGCGPQCLDRGASAGRGLGREMESGTGGGGEVLGRRPRSWDEMCAGTRHRRVFETVAGDVLSSASVSVSVWVSVCVSACVSLSLSQRERVAPRLLGRRGAGPPMEPPAPH